MSEILVRPVIKASGRRYLAQSPDWCRQPIYALGKTRREAAQEYYWARRRIKGYGWDWFEPRDKDDSI